MDAGRKELTLPVNVRAALRDAVRTRIGAT